VSAVICRSDRSLTAWRRTNRYRKWCWARRLRSSLRTARGCASGPRRMPTRAGCTAVTRCGAKSTWRRSGRARRPAGRKAPSSKRRAPRAGCRCGPVLSSRTAGCGSRTAPPPGSCRAWCGRSPSCDAPRCSTPRISGPRAPSPVPPMNGGA
jgi:hypothetical protein